MARLEEQTTEWVQKRKEDISAEIERECDTKRPIPVAFATFARARKQMRARGPRSSAPPGRSGSAGRWGRRLRWVSLSIPSCHSQDSSDLAGGTCEPPQATQGIFSRNPTQDESRFSSGLGRACR